MDELYHWGIKGQRRGDRRFQNYDGSLTPAGRERYGVGSGSERLKKTLGRYKKGAGTVKSIVGQKAEVAKSSLRMLGEDVRDYSDTYKKAKSVIGNAQYRARKMGNAARRLSSEYRSESEGLSKAKQMVYRSKQQMAKVNIARNIKQQADYRARYREGRNFVYKLGRAKATAVSNSNARFLARVNDGTDYLGTLLYSGQTSRGVYGSHQDRLADWIESHNLKDPYDTIGGKRYRAKYKRWDYTSL